MKILYVHHGLRDSGKIPNQDDKLHYLGIKDAKIVAKILNMLPKKFNVKAIYTSTYFRCRETARLINKYINVPIIDEPRFNEFTQSINDGGKNESWLECQNRIRSGIKDIVDKYEDDDFVICVTSGVNITSFISLAYKIQPSDDLPFPMVPSCSPICFDIDKNCF